MSVVARPGVVVRISLCWTALTVMMPVVATRPLQPGSVASPVLIASVILRISALIASHHHMTSSPGTSSLPCQVAALGLPSVGQRLGLQLQVEAGVLGGPGGADGGAAGGNNLEAGPATSQVQLVSAPGQFYSNSETF